MEGDHVVEVRSRVEAVPALIPYLVAEGIPIAAEAVVVDSPQRVDRLLAVPNCHPAADEEVHLAFVGSVRLHISTHHEPLRK